LIKILDRQHSVRCPALVRRRSPAQESAQAVRAIDAACESTQPPGQPVTVGDHHDLGRRGRRVTVTVPSLAVPETRTPPGPVRV
ncbi:MAG: hypothetical protein ACK56F_03185, partial [bacterium]